MINFNARLVSGRIPPNNRSVINLEQNAAKCYCYCTTDGISAVAITDNDYPENSAYIMLNSLVIEFRDHYASDASVYEDAVMDIDEKIKPEFDQIDQYIKKWQDPTEADQMLKLQKELGNVKEIMHENLQDLLKRGENLDVLMERSKDLNV